MKPRNPAPSICLTALLLALAATPAHADPSGFGFLGQALGTLAQSGNDERRAMRERWEQASPEERLQMRREFQERQERLRPVPSDPRRDAAEADRSRGRERRERAEEYSFGFGFERRRQEEEQVLPPMNMPDPSGFFDRRNNRESDRRR